MNDLSITILPETAADAVPIERLHEWQRLPTSELLEQLRADLNRHASGALSDDIALLVVQR